MKLRRFLVAGVTATMSLLVMSPVRADDHADVTLSFFHSANAQARWVHFNPAPPGDPDNWSIELATPFNEYAGADLRGVGTQPPTNPPSFDFLSTISGTSDGSPRLVISFSDGGNILLRPLAWVGNTWTHENGASNDWDNDGHGGTCPFLYETSYAAAIACHAAATVTDAFVVTDSSYAYPTGYIHYIDNISYGSAFITSPEGAGCHERDGSGHFRGDKGDGNVDADSDGCIDGDKDHVDSDNRGDGKDFHSTSVDSVALNSLGNTLTITGSGTSAGAPVTFVLVEVESTPLTSGWVSLSFSDGFTNAGDLLDGSITLN